MVETLLIEIIAARVLGSGYSRVTANEKFHDKDESGRSA
jgi:hypothetical protein